MMAHKTAALLEVFFKATAVEASREASCFMTSLGWLLAAAAKSSLLDEGRFLGF